MNEELWDLTALYPSLESESLKQDLEKFGLMTKSITAWCSENLSNTAHHIKKLEYYLNFQNEVGSLLSKLMDFVNLTLSINTENENAIKLSDILLDLSAELSEPDTCFQKWVSTLENFNPENSESALIRDHAFYLTELKAKAQYLLTTEEEILLSKLSSTGSSAWMRLQEQLTSTLTIRLSVKDKEEFLPLSSIRNLAYSADSNLRQAAYEAECGAYPSISRSVGACLNAIKGEVNTVCKKRGYASPLDMTLFHSKMDHQTLTLMLDTIEESLSYFESYFKRKAELLGHANGLPFYDLFAPLGENTQQYSYQEAKEFIITHFTSFSQKLGDYADYAFRHHWIDVYPKKGKQGGAYCTNLHSIGESRILTNFSGSFNDVITIAHELGHGYHGDCLKSKSYLNSDYPPPIAETASTFMETIVKDAASHSLNKKEAFLLLEADLSDHAQTIIDIYSRFLFEDSVFKRRLNGPLSEKELCDLMIKSQKKAYGKGLDPNYLHPYMWICKSHYYDADCNYYNFPYSFGLLFAKGLFAKYQSLGKDFIPLFDRLLSSTGSSNLIDVAKQANLDLNCKTFWDDSIHVIKKQIDEFLLLSKTM